MPVATVDGASLRYAVSGSGPVVACVPGLGLGPWSWAWVQGGLSGPVSVLTYAPRGSTVAADGGDDQAAGEATAAGERATAGGDGPFTIDRHAADLAAVLADAGVTECHLVGAGVGGQVALACARTHRDPETVTVLGTGAGNWAPAPSLRDRLCSDDAEQSLSPHVGDAFLGTEAGARALDWHRASVAPPRVRAATLEAAVDWNLDAPHERTTPTQVLHGADDAVVAPDRGRRLAAALPRGEFRRIPGGQHLVAVTDHRAVADHLNGFLADHVDCWPVEE
ncbi:MAG: alpha/beta fold hydrolase [Halobacteriaceae archaeon]